MRTILVIESDPNLLKKYENILRGCGYEIMSALCSDEGIKLAIHKIPDLILCNTIFPNKDGCQVLTILSHNPLTSHIPFIFLNPQAEPEEIKRCMDCGADDFITKPFQSNQLINLNSIIKKRTIG